jgi:hypothetical protein
VNTVAYLARVILPGDPQTLLTTARDGMPAGLQSFADRHAHRGYAGRDRDGVWRTWTVRRRRIQLRVGDAAPIEVTTRALLEWALPYLTAPVLAELDTHLAERAAALHAEYGDTELWRRASYQPDELTADDRALLTDARQRRRQAEQAMRTTITACLPTPRPPSPSSTCSTSPNRSEETHHEHPHQRSVDRGIRTAAPRRHHRRPARGSGSPRSR